MDWWCNRSDSSDFLVNATDITESTAIVVVVTVTAFIVKPLWHILAV